MSFLFSLWLYQYQSCNKWIANALPTPRSESDYLVAGAYQEARSVEAIVFVKRFLPLALFIDDGA